MKKIESKANSIGQTDSPESVVLEYVDDYYAWVNECIRLSRLADKSRIDWEQAGEEMLAGRDRIQQRHCLSVTAREYGLSFPSRSTKPPKIPEVVVAKVETGDSVIVKTRVMDKRDRFAALPFNLYKLTKTRAGWKIREVASIADVKDPVNWRKPS